MLVEHTSGTGPSPLLARRVAAPEESAKHPKRRRRGGGQVQKLQLI